jgi:hypothetical protein
MQGWFYAPSSNLSSNSSMPYRGPTQCRNAAPGNGWIGSEIQSTALEVQPVIIRARPGRIYLSGDIDGSSFRKGSILADACYAYALNHRE